MEPMSAKALDDLGGSRIAALCSIVQHRAASCSATLSAKWRHAIEVASIVLKLFAKLPESDVCISLQSFSFKDTGMSQMRGSKHHPAMDNKQVVKIAHL